MTLSEIKSIRKKLKWSYEKFAEEAGVHYNTIYRWENGKVKPSKLALFQMENLKQTLIAKGILKGKRK